MKKALTISLAEQSFVLEEDAYLELSSYLDDIKNYLREEDGGLDAFKDIEQALAEKMKDLLQINKETITKTDVEGLIVVMGTREDFARDFGGDASGSKVEENPVKENDGRTKKRFYRDVENGWLGGVASGLGNYFDTNPNFFRAVFFISTFLFYGFFVVLYILLWIFIPRAGTFSEKLAMYGEVANLENIKLLVVKAKSYQPTFLRKLSDNIFSIFGRVWVIVKRIAGFLLIIGSLFALAGTLFIAFSSSLYRQSDIIFKYVPLKDLFSILPFYIFLITGLILGLSLAAVCWQVGSNWIRKGGITFNFKLFSGLILIFLISATLFASLCFRYLPAVFQEMNYHSRTDYKRQVLDTEGVSTIHISREVGNINVYEVDNDETEVELFGRERDLENIKTERNGELLILTRDQYPTPAVNCWGCGEGFIQVYIPVNKNIKILDERGVPIDFSSSYPLDYWEENYEEVY